MANKNILVDMWYGDKFKAKKYYADVVFYPEEHSYRGNIYSEQGKIIGDYVANSSKAVEENFIINWK